jgi:DNA-binding MarR family transcriptional regulator
MSSITSISPDSESPPLILPPEDDVSFQAWRQLFLTSIKLQRRTETLMGQYDLAMSQFEAMFKVGLRPGQSQQDLCEALLLTKGNIGALVDRLEGMGMLQRRPDEKDRRINRLYLTPLGRQRVTEVFRKHLVVVREMMQPLSQHQLGQLRSLLQLIEPSPTPCAGK